MNTDLIASLANVFGREWLRLSESDKALIVRDCMEGDSLPTIAEGGLSEIQEYRRNIGTGNLESYAKVMRVRFKVSR